MNEGTRVSDDSDKDMEEYEIIEHGSNENQKHDGSQVYFSLQINEPNYSNNIETNRYKF